MISSYISHFVCTLSVSPLVLEGIPKQRAPVKSNTALSCAFNFYSINPVSGSLFTCCIALSFVSTQFIELSKPSFSPSTLSFSQQLPAALPNKPGSYSKQAKRLYQNHRTPISATINTTIYTNTQRPSRCSAFIQSQTMLLVRPFSS